jgi:phage-related protein
MPLVQSLGHSIWKFGASLAGRIARVLFCIEPNCMVLLHGFMKKTQKTPQQEIDLAMKRVKGPAHENGETMLARHIPRPKPFYNSVKANSCVRL